MSIVSHLKDKIERAKGHRDYLREEYVSLKEKLRILKKKHIQIEEAQTIINEIAKQTQEELEYSLSEIVYLAMSIVFDRPYSLNLQWVPKANKTDCILRLEKDGKLFNPLLATGGGMVNISANSLRYAVHNILSRTQHVRNLLILDEPFPGLKGEEANKRALEMVKKITNELGIQIIMISDERVNRKTIFEIADKVYETIQVNDVTTIKEY